MRGISLLILLLSSFTVSCLSRPNGTEGLISHSGQSHVFRKTLVDRTRVESLRFENASVEDISITSVSLEEGQHPFSILSHNCDFFDGLPENFFCKVDIQFAPTTESNFSVLLVVKYTEQGEEKDLEVRILGSSTEEDDGAFACSSQSGSCGSINVGEKCAEVDGEDHTCQLSSVEQLEDGFNCSCEKKPVDVSPIDDDDEPTPSVEACHFTSDDLCRNRTPGASCATSDNQVGSCVVTSVNYADPTCGCLPHSPGSPSAPVPSEETCRWTSENVCDNRGVGSLCSTQSNSVGACVPVNLFIDEPECGCIELKNTQYQPPSNEVCRITSDSLCEGRNVGSLCSSDGQNVRQCVATNIVFDEAECSCL